MKIGIVGRLRSQSANGVDRTIEAHVKQMVRRGHSVTILTFEAPDAESMNVLTELNVKVHVFPNVVSFLFGMIRSRNKFDLLWLHSVFTYTNWFAFQLAGCVWVTTPHGGYSPGQISYKRPFIKRFALGLVERRMLEKALCVHVLSSVEAEQVKLVAPKATTVIAPNGSAPPLEVDSAEWDWEGERNLLFIGRLAWMHKGLDRLLKSLLNVEAKNPWRLDLVGPGSEPQRRYLEEIAQALPCRESVVFRGSLYGPEKDEALDKCHVFVHTSRWEGMPFSVIEALSQGKPVLVTLGTNISELVDQYDAGWVASDDSIAETLREAIDASPETLLRKGENARNLVREVLSWDRIGDHLMSEVEHLKSLR